MNPEPDLSFATSESGEGLLDGTGNLARAKWLEARLRRKNHYLFQDGAFSRLLFSEILECFLAGRDIATIVLGFSFVERSVAGRLSHAGQPRVTELSSEKLLDCALQRNWISVEEHQNLNDIRRLRNPIVHFKEHLNTSRPEIRLLLSARTTTEMLQRDAKHVLEAAIRVLSKTAL